MSEICAKCGLVKELCVCETIAKESQKINVSTERKAFGKIYTVVKGIDGKIELQGDHRQKVKKILVKIGFSPDSIDVR